MQNENHPSRERTLLVVKPDGVQRSLIGEVLKRIERVGMKLVAAKIVVPTEKLVRAHYTVDPEWVVKTGTRPAKRALELREPNPPTPEAAGERQLATLVRYFTSGPVFAMVWQGGHAAAIVRKIIGGTEPLTSDIGTIRGDLMLDSYAAADSGNRAVRNIVHASGNPEEAAGEIKLWFTDSEIVDYRLVQDKILYDVNLDGILE